MLGFYNLNLSFLGLVIRFHMLASPTGLPDYFQRAFGEIFGLIQVEIE